MQQSHSQLVFWLSSLALPSRCSYIFSSQPQATLFALHHKALPWKNICFFCDKSSMSQTSGGCCFSGIWGCCSETWSWKVLPPLCAFSPSCLQSCLVDLNCIFLMQVGVSLVLSFMVVWDLPRIAGGVSSLETSRLSAVYAEVAPSVSIFGELFGRALQAQVSFKLLLIFDPFADDEIVIYVSVDWKKGMLISAMAPLKEHLWLKLKYFSFDCALCHDIEGRTQRPALHMQLMCHL